MMGKYDHINFKPPKGVRAEAEKALAWRRKFGRGGTAVGIARARDLSNGVTISPETARRMKAYFDRHQSDKDGEGWSPGEAGFPSNGRVAWGLWGSDEGWAWSRKLVEQMNAADERPNTRNRSHVMNIERRSLLSSVAGFLTVRVESRSEEVIVDGRPQMTRRDWCVGYASVFGALSLDLRDEAGDFVERIDPRAFDRVLAGVDGERGVEPRALWNHNPNFPLARYPETLKLSVDERGLRYEFPFPRSSYGQDLRMNIEDGIVKGSSFGFTCAPGGERWGMENGRSVRTVMEIEALYDVSPTTYPAYPDSDVAVAKRSYDQFLRSGGAGGRTEPKKPVAITRRSAEYREFMETHGRKIG
jgi:HK97 family phage prohead protease